MQNANTYKNRRGPRLLTALFTFAALLFSPVPLFAEEHAINLDRLDEGYYVCTYEEHYYDGVGESVFTLKKISGGYEAVWDGISDSTTLYADENFRTQGITLESEKRNLQVERRGDRIEVTGTVEGEQVEKTLKLDSPHWFQMLPFSLISFVRSGEDEVEFSLFDPFNMKMRNMKISRKGEEGVNLFGTDYRTVKLNMRMRGFLSPFWKAEIWTGAGSGTHVKYEGLNVEPKRHKSKIYLKRVEFVPEN